MKDFKVCQTCKTPSACKAAMKCGGMVKKKMSKGGMVAKGYAKGGMVKSNCGASMKPTQKRTK